MIYQWAGGAAVKSETLLKGGTCGASSIERWRQLKLIFCCLEIVEGIS